jgi:hypothetical protein
MRSRQFRASRAHKGFDESPAELLAGDQAVPKCERVIGHQLSSLALPPIILPPRNLSELIILDKLTASCGSDLLSSPIT